MKYISGIILFVITIFFLSCSSIINSKERDKEKTILLKANGEVSFQPNEASIVLTLNCLSMNIDSSKKCIIQKSQELNKAILDYGIKPEDILTTSINLSKEYEWHKNSNVFAGYASSVSTRITIRNMSVLERLYADLLVNKNITISDLSYSHSKLDSLNQQAYLNALENANNLADKLIVKINGSKKEISRIGNIDLPSENSEKMEFTEEEKAIMAANGQDVYEPKIKINNGILKINRSIIVEYKIK